MTYLDIATKLLKDELEYLNKNPDQACDDFNWGTSEKPTPRLIKQLAVTERATKVLADKIKLDHEIGELWGKEKDGSCKFDDLMTAEYYDDIMKDFVYQMKSVMMSIPISFPDYDGKTL